MAKQIKDTITRKYDLKGAYFEDGKIMIIPDKDAEPVEVDLMKDLKDFFLDNEFNITVQMKSENEVEEPEASATIGEDGQLIYDED